MSKHFKHLPQFSSELIGKNSSKRFYLRVWEVSSYKDHEFHEEGYAISIINSTGVIFSEEYYGTLHEAIERVNWLCNNQASAETFV